MFNSLPSELYSLVLNYLDYSDIINAGLLTCKIDYNYEKIWKKLCKQYKFNIDSNIKPYYNLFKKCMCIVKKRCIICNLKINSEYKIIICDCIFFPDNDYYCYQCYHTDCFNNNFKSKNTYKQLTTCLYCKKKKLFLNCKSYS